LFTDSAGGQNRGFGIYFQGKWAQKCWPKLWEDMDILKDISFLELFPVVVALCNSRVSFEAHALSVITVTPLYSDKKVNQTLISSRIDFDTRIL
jgi:hypothetical protein